MVCQLTLTGLRADGCYEQTVVVDANGHQTATLADGWGRAGGSETFTGHAAPYTLYQQTQEWYDYTGGVAQVIHPDGTSTTSLAYDDAGRVTALDDPDRGHETYTYDADGNLTASVDARGASGTVYAGYDPLNRPLWRNTTNSPTGAFVTYTYDSTAGGNDGIGHLTGESFTGGPNTSWSGSYASTYDARGQQTAMTETVNGTSYPTSATYDDAGQPSTQTYPDGEQVRWGYTAQEWLSDLTTTQSGHTTTLVGTLVYSGAGGALGEPASVDLDQISGTNTYRIAASYDALGRVSDTTTTLASSGATLFEETPTYDAAGNVVAVTTTLPAGTDHQAFCYDDLNRLTWAGSAGTPACGGTLTPGTLTSAEYTAAYSYDSLDRLTSGPAGSYTYGDAAHLDAATSVSGGYSARYDASGNLTCRAATSASTCAGGSPTGAQLTYDAEGRLSHWQSAPTNAQTTDDALYDGEGNRVLQQSQQTEVNHRSTTVYVGSLEEVTTDFNPVNQPATTTTTTAYYELGGKRIAESVNGVVSYLASDLLGSGEVALSASGGATASLLYGPYGTTRYTNGTMPGSYGFTDQHDDTALLGLDYYGARYYDPSIGQFTSADTDPAGGLNRYAYVRGNPETATDPSGHRQCSGVDDCDGGNSGGSGGSPSPTPTPTKKKPPQPTQSSIQAGGDHSDPLILRAKVGGGGGLSYTTRPGDCLNPACSGSYIQRCALTTFCTAGHDRDGLWTLLGGEFGDATDLIVKGADGLHFIAEKLGKVKDAVDSYFTDHAELGAAAGTIITLFTPVCPFCVVAGGLVLASGVKDLVTKKGFDDMLGAVIGEISGAADAIDNGEWAQFGPSALQSVEFDIKEVSTGSSPEDPQGMLWEDQTFTVQTLYQLGPVPSSQ